MHAAHEEAAVALWPQHTSTDIKRKPLTHGVPLRLRGPNAVNYPCFPSFAEGYLHSIHLERAGRVGDPLGRVNFCRLRPPGGSGATRRSHQWPRIAEPDSHTSSSVGGEWSRAACIPAWRGSHTGFRRMLRQPRARAGATLRSPNLHPRAFAVPRLQLPSFPRGPAAVVSRSRYLVNPVCPTIPDLALVQVTPPSPHTLARWVASRGRSRATLAARRAWI